MAPPTPGEPRCARRQTTPTRDATRPHPPQPMHGSPRGPWMPRQKWRPRLKSSNANWSMEAVPRVAEAPIEASGESPQGWFDARLSGDAGPPTWRPQPGEILAGVIARYDELVGAVRAAAAPPGGADGGALPLARSGPRLPAGDAPHGPPRDARFFPFGWRSVRRGTLALGAARGHGRRRIDAVPPGGRMNPSMPRGIRGMEDVTVEALAPWH
jgi:hypothetical protein